MQPFDSLNRRITTAFVLFGVVLSLSFAVLAAIAVEGIEEHLVDDRLAEVEKWAAPRQSAGLQSDLPAGLRFHRGEDIPASLRGLPSGVSNVTVDGADMHVLSGSDAHGPYVVVDHESDYEKVEVVVYSLFGAFFALFVLFAVCLGRFVGRRIVVPAIGAHTAAIRQVLDRERYFTGDVSHELRTPLAVIMGAAEILLENGERADVREPAQRILLAAREASERIAVLLLLARAPRLADCAAVQIGAIVQAETERQQAMVASKPVRLECEVLADFAVRAPRELLISAVANLVRNACHHTDSGVVRVQVDAGAVLVEDTGPGLPDAVRQTLGQTGTAVSTGSAGTGLGLSLVQRICAYLGAEFAYAERSGGGSRFSIRFTQS